MKPGHRTAFWLFLLSCGMVPLVGIQCFFFLPVFLIGGWLLGRDARKRGPRPLNMVGYTKKEIERRYQQERAYIKSLPIPNDEKQPMYERAYELRKDRYQQLQENMEQ